MEAERLRLIMQPITNILHLAVAYRRQAAGSEKLNLTKFECVNVWHISTHTVYRGWVAQSLCGDVGYVDKTLTTNCQSQQELERKTGTRMCADCADKYQSMKDTTIIKGGSNEPEDVC